MAAFRASGVSGTPQSAAQRAAATEALARRGNPLLMAVVTRTLEAMHVKVQEPLQALRAAVLAQILSTNDIAIAKEFLSDCGLGLTKELAKVASLRKESADGGYYFEKDFGREDAEALVRLIWDYGVWPTAITTPVIDQAYVDESRALEQRDDVDTDLLMVTCKGTRLPTAILRLKKLKTLVISSDTLTCLPRALRDLNLDTLDVSECPNLIKCPHVAQELVLPLGSVKKVL